MAHARGRGPVLPLCLLAAAVLWSIGTYAATASVPFLSETYSHLAVARSLDGLADAFDPSLQPLRPLQHAFFLVLDHLDVPRPGLARLPGLIAHLGAVFALAALVRGLGAPPTAAALAGLAFALQPNVKSLTWVAAVGWPFRVCLTLLVPLLLLRHHERPRPALGAAAAIAFVVALGFHQGAVLAAPLAVLVLAARFGLAALPQRLLEPATAAVLVLAAAYAGVVALAAGEGAQSAVSASAMVANVAKAPFVLAPEALRAGAVEALRGDAGDAWLAAAAALWVAAGALVAAGMLRGAAPVRALLTGSVLELGLVIGTTGIAQRYAYLAGALLAGALAFAAAGASRAGRRVAAAALVVLLPGWAWDSWRDAGELRDIGTEVQRLVADLVRARQDAGAGVTVTVVDPPQFGGSEDDVPVFNWGLREALALHGAAGPWSLLRTGGHPWPNALELVTPAEARQRVQQAAGPVVDLRERRPRERDLDGRRR